MDFIPYFDKAKAVEVELDKPRLLYFNIGSAAELERKMGSSIMMLFQTEQKGMSTMTSMYFLRTAYQIGLQADEPGLTQQRVDELLQTVLDSCETPQEHMQALLGLGTKVIESLRGCGAFPKAKKEETAKPAKPVGKPRGKKSPQ